MVETFISGKDYRILVVNNQVVAVAERVPAHVMGDGTHTVAELVEITNADPRRGIGHEKILTRITVDAQTIEVLAGLALDDVPEEGRFVQLKLTGNMSTGGTSIDRTDDIHPDNVEIARQAAMVVGLDVAGIDFITADIARSVREQRGGSWRSMPDPASACTPTPPRDTRATSGGGDRHALPTRQPIPRADRGRHRHQRQDDDLTHDRPHHEDGRQEGRHDDHRWDLCRCDADRRRRHERAHLGADGAEEPGHRLRGAGDGARGILRSGLGFDRCDVAVVTNVSSDHLGLKGINTVAELARVKQVVPQSVLPNGASVLNADNSYTVEMARVARGEIIFFSMDEENPVVRDHLRERGKAVVLRRRGTAR